jgi:hypothetical protein
MKQITIILLCLTAFALRTTTAIAQQPQQQPLQQPSKVAIFDPIGQLPSGLKTLIREKISSVVTKSASYRAVERSLIDKVLEENKFQAKGFVDESQLSEMGRKAGADVVCLTTIVMIDKNFYYVSCKVINYTTSQIQKQRTGQTPASGDNLEKLIETMARELFTQKK